jgi:cytidylate kinase
VRRSDASHAARMNTQFGVTWGDPLLYDLVLNTERISVDSCAEQILRWPRAPNSRRRRSRAPCWPAWRSAPACAPP